MASTSSATNKGKRDGPYAEATRRHGPEKTFAHAMKELEEDSQLLGDPRVHLGLVMLKHQFKLHRRRKKLNHR